MFAGSLLPTSKVQTRFLATRCSCLPRPPMPFWTISWHSHLNSLPFVKGIFLRLSRAFLEVGGLALPGRYRPSDKIPFTVRIQLSLPRNPNNWEKGYTPLANLQPGM